MKKDPAFENDQLNNEPSSPEPTYDVEDIIAEFGSQASAPAAVDDGEDEKLRIWSPRTDRRKAVPAVEAEAPSEPETQTASEKDPTEAAEEPTEKAPEPRQRRRRPHRAHPQKTAEAPDVSEEVPDEVQEISEEMPEDAPEAPRKTAELLLRRLGQQRARLREALDASPNFTLAQARSAYLQRRGARRLPLLLSWLLTLISVTVVLLPTLRGIGLSVHLTTGLRSAVCIGVLLFQLLLTLPVLMLGIQKILVLRFSKESYLALMLLVVLIQGFRCLFSAETGSELCAVASLLLTVALHGDNALISAKATCLSRVLSMRDPIAVVRCADRWDGRDCLTRGPVAPDNWLPTLEEMPAAEKQLSGYSLFLFTLTFAVALVVSVKGGRDFLWSWSILLLGACPLGTFWAYGRSFCTLNRRLSSIGAAVPGWGGASRLSGSICVILRDEDLFTGKGVSLNGIKVFGAHSPERLLGYAAAMLDHAGAGTAAAFSESLDLRNGRRFHTDHFRAYDVGGLGAEIQGDVVLLGSRNFLKTMGVEIPSEAQVKQALYISVNGEAAGLFALRYSASDPVRSGLGAILDNRGLHPILATRDALLTPDTVGKLYRISPDRLDFPVLRDRIALSDPDVAQDGVPCALLARDSFLGFSATITGGRRLCRSFRKALRIAMLGSLFGLLTMILLALKGSYTSASAANLLLYHLIWLIPSVWATSSLGS